MIIGGEHPQQQVVQLPTIPGKVGGIVGWDPCVLQCRVCGVTAKQEGRSAAMFIVQSGFRFHRCEEREGIRMCPDCLTDATNACPDRRCKP